MSFQQMLLYIRHPHVSTTFLKFFKKFLPPYLLSHKWPLRPILIQLFHWYVR
jgi:hypothetical protein